MSHSVEELKDMLDSVVDELCLSQEMLDKHGPLGTEPAELVRLVIEQKDRQIRALRQGFKEIHPRKFEGEF